MGDPSKPGDEEAVVRIMRIGPVKSTNIEQPK